MRRFAAVLSLACLIALPARGEAAADGAAAARVREAIGAIGSLRAEFRQSVTDAKGRVIERAEGTMALSRPGKFRWDYRVPAQLVVSDGRTVWVHDVDLEQVTIRAASEALAGTPAMLLLGEGDLDSEFTLRDGGQSDGLAWTRLEPRKADGDFRELRVGLSGRELRRLLLYDRLGQTTDIEFSRVERNPRLDPASFRFTPPPGVDIVGRAPAGSPP